MNGEYVGQWRVSAKGEHSLHYDPSWVDSSLGRPVSISMPLRPPSAPYKGAVVLNFFENLLPDSEHVRRRIAERFGTSMEAFNLLREIGRDCVGALQLLPEDMTPGPLNVVEASPLTERAIEKHLSNVPRSAAFGDDDGGFRISLAGAQEKTALLFYQGKWCRPLGGTPSTHIFKLPLGELPNGIDLRTSVENEWLSLSLVRAFGVPVARADIHSFGPHRALVVERFDRKPARKGGFLRLPVEDFCQVFGVSIGQKYEEKGGPGIRSILEQLAGSGNALRDRYDFFRTQVVYWMLAAIDGHAKNYSIFLEPRGAYRLTPRYDVLSAYPVMGKRARQLSPHKVKLGMAVWGKSRHYRWSEIRRSHFEKTGAACGIPNANKIIDELVVRAPHAVTEVKKALRRGFPAQVAEPIFEGVRRAAVILTMEGKRDTMAKQPGVTDVLSG